MGPRSGLLEAPAEISPVMRAAVYVGESRVEVREIETPRPGPGEILIRVASCGICHTDLKKIEYNLLAAPRVYGHETAGVVAAVGAGVERYSPGDRVIAFHHIPCRECFYCRRKLYAQCPVYKRVGVTAGFEPAGGGFAEYVRVFDWIVRDGVERIPDGVSFDRACFVEPVNTCLKGAVQLAPERQEVLAVLGQGPIGLIFTKLVERAGAHVIATDTIERRRALALRFGAVASFDPGDAALGEAVKERTEGRGADAVIIAASAPGIVDQAVRLSRPGARILLFAQTSAKERIELAGADICVQERTLFGCYSASVDLQRESAELVFSGDLPVEELISHRVALEEIDRGFALARRPDERTLKIIVQPQRCS
ncbi:MAG: alcohol dehydrogenase catalytic domain-containing protein [Bryobacteraceae bacterium]|nr:alcohol dehydrogenase catalytic domain-containing protein [Bryobacteraceae bacterium]